MTDPAAGVLERRDTVCVVGAGVSRLAAAFRLKQAGIPAIVLEASGRVGGRVKTVHVGGCAFDVGAIGLLGSYAQTAELIKDIGLGPRLSRGRVRLAIPRAGTLHVLDMARPLLLLGTRLLSWGSLLRLLRLGVPLARCWSKLDFLSISAMAPVDHETVEVFSRRDGMSRGSAAASAAPMPSGRSRRPMPGSGTFALREIISPCRASMRPLYVVCRRPIG